MTKGWKAKGKTLPKTSQHSDARVAELKAANENKKHEQAPPEKTKGRLARAYKSAAEQFKKVAAKVRRKSATEKQVNMGGTKVKPLLQSNADRAAAHAKREKAASAGKAQAKAAQQNKAKVQHGRALSSWTPGTRAPSPLERLHSILRG